MADVRLVNVVKEYDKGVKVVKGFNIDIKDGEFIVLVGPSGCGKSTTLNMIAGLETVTSGDIYIGDRKVNDLPSKDRDIGMVFQNYALLPNMNVYENIGFGLTIRKVKKAEKDKLIRHAAKILKIDELLERKPKALSGGQRQRVAIGRCIVREPEVFLMDEPLSNLDAKLRGETRKEIKSLHNDIKKTFIYVTHDQTEAMSMGTRIVVMDKGEVQQIDTPYNVYHYPENIFVAGFIGSPKMNIVCADVKVEKDMVILELDNGALLIPPKHMEEKLLDKGYEGKKISVGFRPEKVMPVENNVDVEFNVLSGVVDLVEMVGSDEYIHFKFGENTITAKSSGSNYDKKTIGNKAPFIVDTKTLHVFDVDTGKAI